MGDETGLSADEERLVRILKALGNETRFGIIKMLRQRNACICGAIVESTPLAQSTVSQHLKVLKDAGLVRGEVEGAATCYCLNQDTIDWLKRQVSGL